MSIASQNAIFSFALQTAKIDEGGSFTHASLTWYKMRAPRVALGTVQQQQVLVPELGGDLTPAGAFKAGYFFTAEVDVIPRLEDNLGWLLLATMGACSTVTGTDADAVAATSVNTHIFTYDTDASEQPWMAMRRMTPGTGGDFGEAGFDCKVALLRLTVPSAGKLAARFQVLGRDTLYDDASGWAYDNASFEDSDTTPDAGRGQFKLHDTEHPIVGATVDIINGLSTPQQEAIVGQFTPDDFIALSRVVTIRMVYKWENEDWYREILTGSASGTTWDSLPFQEVSDSNYFAFDARFEAPKTIPSSNPATRYRLRLRANKVLWSVDGPPELAAGGIIMQAFTGTVMEPDSGSYFEVVLENDATAYVVS